jgi:hypothetical protein
MFGRDVEGRRIKFFEILLLHTGLSPVEKDYEASYETVQPIV